MKKEEKFEIQLHINDKGEIELNQSANYIVKDITVENAKRITIIMDSETSKLHFNIFQLGEETK